MSLQQTNPEMPGTKQPISGLTLNQSTESGARHHFIIAPVIDLNNKTVQMHMGITKGYHVQALALLKQHVLDALGFEQCIGPVCSYEDACNLCRFSQSALKAGSSCG